MSDERQIIRECTQRLKQLMPHREALRAHWLALEQAIQWPAKPLLEYLDETKRD